MLKINYVNVTIWVLSAILVLILLVVSIWRIVKKDNNKDATPSNLKTARELIDLSKSLNQVYDIPSLVNILFKNRFAKNKHSLIPLLAFKKQNAYLILNPIKADLSSQFLIKKNYIYYTFKNKNLTINFKSTFEIIRFLQSINLNVKIIIPSSSEMQTDNILFLPIEEIGDYIKADQSVLNQNSISEAIKKISNINLFNKKTTRGGQYV